MPFHEILKQTLSALWETKLRSFLTMFGIVWGITSVILLVGLGIGFNADQKQRLRSIGTDIAILFGGKTGAQAGGYAAGRDIRLTIDDAIAIQQQATLVKTVSPELRRTVSEVSQWNSASRAVRGVWPEYQRFRSLAVDQAASCRNRTKPKAPASFCSELRQTASSFPARKSSASLSW